MKKTLQEKIAVVAVKSEFVQSLPNPKKIYETGFEYGKENRWNFDEEKYLSNNDEDKYYSDAVNTDWQEYNERARAYNALLESVVDFLC